MDNSVAQFHELVSRRSAALIAELQKLCPPRLPKSLLEALFKVPLIRNACVELPSSAAGAGWRIGFDGDEENADEINKSLTEWEEAIASTLLGEEPPKDGDHVIGLPRTFGQVFCEAQILANIYGGAAIVIVAEDGVPYNEPINLEGLQTIRRLVVMDQYRITPLTKGGVNPGEPLQYQLNMHDRDWMGTNKILSEDPTGTVHHSRIIRFDGIKLTPDQLVANGGWGESVITGIILSYLRFIRTINSAANSAENHRLLTLKIKGLNDMLKRKRTQELESKLTNMKMWVDLMGAIALDSEEEEAGFINNTFSGMDQVISQTRDLLIGETNIPHDRLFGESPSGLGATGENERSNWGETVDNFRKNEWLAKLRKLYKLCWHCQVGPTQGNVPDGWKITFNDMIEPTPQENIDLKAAEADADIKRVEAGILLKKEARSRIQSPGYDAALVLDDKAWEEQEKKAEQEQKQMQDAKIEQLKNPAMGADPNNPMQPPTNGNMPPTNGKAPQPPLNGNMPTNGKLPNQKTTISSGKKFKGDDAKREDDTVVGANPAAFEFVEQYIPRDPELWEKAITEARKMFNSEQGMYIQVHAESIYRQLEEQNKLQGEGVKLR